MSVGLRYMLVASFFFSVMSVFVKLAGQTLPSQMIVLARALVTLVLTGAMLRARGIDWRGTRRGMLLLRGAFGFLALSAFYWSVTHLPLGDATVIQYTNPVLTAIFAALWLGERPVRRDLLSVAGAIIGVLLIARPAFLPFIATDRSLDPFAVGVAVFASVMSALAYVVVRALRSTEDPLVIVFYFPLVAVPATIPTVWSVARMPVGVEWFYLLAVGVATQIAQVYMTRGLHLESAARAATVTYIQIVFAYAWGILLFAEHPDRWGLLGTLVVLGSTLGPSLAQGVLSRVARGTTNETSTR